MSDKVSGIDPANRLVARIQHAVLTRVVKRQVVLAFLLLPLLSAPVGLSAQSRVVLLAVGAVAVAHLGYACFWLSKGWSDHRLGVMPVAVLAAAITVATAANFGLAAAGDAVRPFVLGHAVATAVLCAALYRSKVRAGVYRQDVGQLGAGLRSDPEPEPGLRSDAEPEPGLRSDAEPEPGLRPDPQPELAIACSGGGIRAAAFCLGGLQELRRGSEHPLSYSRAAAVYAVSGGGYVATGLHLAEREASNNLKVMPLFGPGSPEEGWLRRKSGFLLPTSAARLRAVLSVVYGIAVNFALVACSLYLAVRWAAWLHREFETFGESETVGERPLDAIAVSTGTADTPWWLVAKPSSATWASPHDLVGPWFLMCVGVLVFLVAKIGSKYVWEGRLRFAGLTQALLVTGLTLGLLLAALPGAVAGLHNSAVRSEPAPVVARAVVWAGLVSPAACETAAAADLRQEARLAYERHPRVQDAKMLPFSYRSCGQSWTDDALVFSPGSDALATAGDCRATTQSGPQPRYCNDLQRASLGVGGLQGFVALVLAAAAAVRAVRLPVPSTSGGRAGRLAQRVVSTVVPWLGTVVLLVAFCVVVLLLFRQLVQDPVELRSWWGVGVATVGFLLVRVLSDATISSLHPFYRERLSDAFLVRRSGNEAVPLTDSHALRVQSEKSTKPELVVCCAANIADIDYVPAQRGCAPFRFQTGPVRSSDELQGGSIGISDHRLPKGGMKPSEAYSTMADPQGLDTTLAAAMAASGAAFSPLVGRLSRSTRPYRVLLALANARLGVWLPNPYKVPAAPAPAPERPLPVADRVRWVGRRALKPGPFRIFKEAFGSPSIHDSFLYITDGGHYDNTAIVEALRDRPRNLVALDASADQAGSLEALGVAITTARMDLGLVITPDPDTPLADLQGDSPTRSWVHLTVATVDQPDIVVCDVFFVKNVLPAGSRFELFAYKGDYPEFPITSTVNQFFGEYDFEAYRLLGAQNTADMLRCVVPPTSAAGLS